MPLTIVAPSLSLTIFKNDILEIQQPGFLINKLNTSHYGAFGWITNSQLVLNSTRKNNWNRSEFIIEKDSCSLNI